MPIDLERDRVHWLDPSQEPTWPYYVEFADGRRGEALTPHYLMELIIHEGFAELYWGTDDGETQTFYLLGVKILRDIASGALAMEGIRATVYDGVGPFYDPVISRHPDDEDEELEFENMDDPIILDGWDPWTVTASLIRAGYIRVFEKYPTWSGDGPSRKKKCDGCVFNKRTEWKNGEQEVKCAAWDVTWVGEHAGDGCPYITHGAPYLGYHEVKPEELPDPADWKDDWVPVTERKTEYPLFRRRKEEEEE